MRHELLEVTLAKALSVDLATINDIDNIFSSHSLQLEVRELRDNFIRDSYTSGRLRKNSNKSVRTLRLGCETEQQAVLRLTIFYFF